MHIKRSKFSFTGIAVGGLALLLALVHFQTGRFAARPTLEQTVADSAFSIKNATIKALKGEPAPARRFSRVARSPSNSPRSRWG